MNATKRKAPSTRAMERINWIEFREWVPAKVRTVLLPLGTLEPHGVAPNGTDILAPVAMAREIGPALILYAPHRGAATDSRRVLLACCQLHR